MTKGILKITTICLLFLTVLQFNVNATAISAEFTYDEASISQEFAPVAQLENYLVVNFEQADVNFVKQNNNLLLAAVEKTINLNPTLPLDSDKNPILGIPSFVWGLCLGVIGIVVVAVVGDDLPKDERKEQVKKSAIGCLVGYGVGALIYFISIGSLFAAAS
jgi:hypothetical protein